MRRQLNICMVSDFFYPSVGGIESHIYQLAYCLKKRGHNVIIVTRAYGTRVGARYISGNIKVYYLPIPAFNGHCILPTMLVTLSPFRNILLGNKIDVVHGHSAFSTMAHEALFHAKIFGIRTVFTDHSLFGFADAASIVTNQLLCMSLATCDHVVCVSHMSKENTVLRARFLDPWSVSVIPNAVDASKFLPNKTTHRKSDHIYVVTVSRLVYRRGIDLLAQIIPPICAKFPQVRFLIGGDGPKRILLEETREKHRLQDSVILLGRVDHDKVPDLLRQGSIYINTSLTEAFCISIIEAAAVGLLVVSTKVGGIPEVLPSDMMRLAEPNPSDLQACLETALEEVLHSKERILSPTECHERIKKMYSWDNVAQRTELVYEKAFQKPILSVRDMVSSSWNHCGFISRIFMTVLLILDLIFLRFLDTFVPLKPKFPKSEPVSNGITQCKEEPSNQSRRRLAE